MGIINQSSLTLKTIMLGLYVEMSSKVAVMNEVITLHQLFSGIVENINILLWTSGLGPSGYSSDLKQNV